MWLVMIHSEYQAIVTDKRIFENKWQKKGRLSM